MVATGHVTVQNGLAVNEPSAFNDALVPNGPLDHNCSTAGFFGASPVGRQTVRAAATNNAQTQTLANDLRAALIALGWVQ